MNMMSNEKKKNYSQRALVAIKRGKLFGFSENLCFNHFFEGFPQHRS